MERLSGHDLLECENVYLNQLKYAKTNVSHLLKRNICCVVQIIILADKAWVMLLAYDEHNICWDVVWSLWRKRLNSVMTKIYLQPRQNKIVIKMCSVMPGLPVLETWSVSLRAILLLRSRLIFCLLCWMCVHPHSWPVSIYGINFSWVHMILSLPLSAELTLRDILIFLVHP